MKGFRKWIAGLLVILTLALLWLFYDSHLKYEINDYRANLIKEDIYRINELMRLTERRHSR